MDVKHVAIGLIAFAVFSVTPCMQHVGFIGSSCAEAQTVAPPPMPGEELPAGSEVLTSGPVHEAFAKPVTLQAQAGVIVPKPPPANIQEVPPAQKPQGANVVWIPGYWAWDNDRNDYIWVSGCWRVAPPGMYWMPGYWSAVAGGYEWVAGFWAPLSEQSQEVEYLPPPPAPIDLEPPGEPPLADDIWVPGCWYWTQGQYVPRHGYWLTARTGWLWGPSHYSWTPRGYVFCPGHWDYPLNERGILLAPVYFPPAVQVRAGFVFSPSICVDLGILKINLFAYPRYNHYYFGDFYDDAYLRLGIYPWFDCESNFTWYDPIFEYNRWYLHKVAPNWEERERHEYDLRRADRSLRPAKTWSEMEARAGKLPEAERKFFRTAEPVNTFVTGKTQPLKFVQINNAERQNVAVQAAQVHEFRQQRNVWEGPVKGSSVGLTPAEHKAPAVTTPTPTRLAPVTPTPAEHKGPVVTTPTPTEHKGPVVATPPPTEHKTVAEQRPAFVPPREVRATQPEKVTIPAPPIVAKPVERTVEKAVPSHPTEERSQVTENRSAPPATSHGGGGGTGPSSGTQQH